MYRIWPFLVGSLWHPFARLCFLFFFLVVSTPLYQMKEIRTSQITNG